MEAAPPPPLARALGDFEREFSYPLGPGRSFRIDHGDDYLRFFRAMGRAVCFVVEDEGRVLGTFAVVTRQLGFPDGSERPVVYCADLKVTAAARSSGAAYQLCRAALEWSRGAADAGFSVVMDGTVATPDRYTGRLGLPSFAPIAKIAVLRLPTADGRPEGSVAGPLDTPRHGDDAGAAGRCYRDLSRGRYCSVGGDPAERSDLAPVWFLDSGGAACGRLEDTRRGKRLLDSDGFELLSAHLSCFAFRHLDAATALLRAAARRAGALGYPALFVAVTHEEAAAVQAALLPTQATVAPATVYGAGLEVGAPWHINTAEI